MFRSGKSKDGKKKKKQQKEESSDESSSDSDESSREVKKKKTKKKEVSLFWFSKVKFISCYYIQGVPDLSDITSPTYNIQF